MAKAIAKCTCKECGATFTVSAVKPNRREADSWKDWAADYYTLCPDCQEKEYKEAAAYLAEEAQKEGLPALTGSEKQIRGAEQIRAEKMEKIKAEIEKNREKMNQTKDGPAKEMMSKVFPEVEMTFDWIRQISSSRWWIDIRNLNGEDILLKAYGEAKEAHFFE